MKSLFKPFVVAFLLATAPVVCKAADANEPRTVAVSRGSISALVHCRGTIEPQETVDVSAPVAGGLASLGPDPRGETDPRFKGKTVDFKTPVKKGDLLAAIDDQPYRQEVELAKANLDLAAAETSQAQLKLDAATKKDPGAGSDEAKAAEADVRVAKAREEQANVALKKAQENLAATRILAPIDGTIIDVRAQVGQMVTAGAQPTSLFLIGDLHRLQVKIEVPETYIGAIHEGQAVTYTCDAVPGKTMAGKISRVGLNAFMNPDSVYYPVFASLESPPDALLPYLTAKVGLTVTRKDVLCVPSAAVRAADKDHLPGGKPRQCVWIKSGGSTRRIIVQTGLSDDSKTEILGDGLRESDAVVIDPDAGSRERQ